MNPGVLLIFSAAASAGCYNFFQKVASKHIYPPFAAFISALVVAINSLLIILLSKSKSQPLLFSKTGLIAAMAIGLSATGIELLGIWAYSKGLPVSVGSFFMAGVPAITATMLGLLFLGESVNLTKIFAMSLIVLGTIILTR